MSGKTYYIDNNGTRHLIKKKIHIDANGVPTQIKKKFFEGKNTFSSSHIVKYHVDVNDIRDIEVDDGGDAILWAPTPAISGWIFVGWREDTSANPSVVDHKTVEVDGVHLYAVFRKVITITLQGGSSAITNTGTRYYNNGNTENPVIKLGTSAISGWNLIGYRDDMTATATVSYTAGQSYTFTESKTLYAVFNRTLTLSYNGNNATAGSVAAQTGTQYYNNGYYANPSFTIRANAFRRNGYCDYPGQLYPWKIHLYNFAGWGLNQASTVQYQPGGTITLSNSAILYVVWSVDNVGINDNHQQIYSIGGSYTFTASTNHCLIVVQDMKIESNFDITSINQPYHIIETYKSSYEAGYICAYYVEVWAKSCTMGFSKTGTGASVYR